MQRKILCSRCRNPWAGQDLLLGFNIFYAAVFSIEAGMRLLAQGPLGYVWQHSDWAWNWLDMFAARPNQKGSSLALGPRPRPSSDFDPNCQSRHLSGPCRPYLLINTSNRLHHLQNVSNPDCIMAQRDIAASSLAALIQERSSSLHGWSSS